MGPCVHDQDGEFRIENGESGGGEHKILAAFSCAYVARVADRAVTYVMGLEFVFERAQVIFGEDAPEEDF